MNKKYYQTGLLVLFSLCLASVAWGTLPGSKINGKYYLSQWTGQTPLLVTAITDVNNLNAQVTLVIDANDTLSSSPAVDKEVSLEFISGYKITIPVQNGYSLTINGPCQAGTYQIFDTMGNASGVVFGGECRAVRVAWYGAVGNGTTDDYFAIMAAVQSAPGGIITLSGDKIYGTSAKIVINTHYTQLVGENGNTEIKWLSASNDYVIQLVDTWQAKVRNLLIDCNYAANGIALDISTGTNQKSEINTCKIRNPVVGIVINSNATLAPQIDGWKIENVMIQGAIGTTVMTNGIYINSQNSTGKIDSSIISGIAANGAGIDIKGSLVLKVLATNFGAATDTGTDAIRLSGSYGAVSIDSCQAEQIGYFLHKTSASPSLYVPIKIDGCVINDPIKLDVRARLVTSGCYFYGSNGTTYPLVIFNDSRNIWTDLASQFANNTLENYIQLNGTLDIVTLVQSTKDATTEFAIIPNQINYIGLNKNVLRGSLKLVPGTAPSSPTEGMIYADSSSHKLYYYNGTSWVSMTP